VRLRSLLVFLGLTQLGLGVFMALAPGTFYDLIATYGQRNDHFLRDFSTFYVALGSALIVSATRPAWRVPVLALATIEYGLHSLNHLVDISKANPDWLGPFNFVSLVLFTTLLVYALRAAPRSAE
jgi:hypothetical protein